MNCVYSSDNNYLESYRILQSEAAAKILNEHVGKGTKPHLKYKVLAKEMINSELSHMTYVFTHSPHIASSQHNLNSCTRRILLNLSIQ